nr:hypothetical protein [Tanacetum cinerariifolium]
MKGYVEQLERLGYVLPQEISVGLIMIGLTSDFVDFVRNYNMHNMGKMIGELHALLIEYGKDLPKKAATPQVLAVQGARIFKSNKKSQNAKEKGKGKGKGKDTLVYAPKPKNSKTYAKEHPTKDDACHHCKEVGHWKRIVLLFKNDILYFNVIPHDGIYKIDMLNLVPNINSIYNVRNERARYNLDFTYMWHFRLAHIKMQPMKDNQVWRLVDLPPNARLIAKGYTQTYEIHYEETFSHVADIRAIRIHIDIAAFYDYKIWQMDVKIAFLNGYLEEDIYMVQPEGFFDPKHPRKVCKLQRFIYRLMQASRSSKLRVTFYCDARFETDKDDIKYQTRYVFVLNGGVVDWKSSKQSTTAMSATEVEHIVVSEAAMDAV